MFIEELEKEPFDKFGYGLRYHRVMALGERISSCALSATLLSDATDVTSTFLESSTATIPSGTATSGSKTTIINTAVVHGTSGWRIGDWVLNATQGYMAMIKDIRKTTAAGDTLVFDEQAIAAAASDAYYALKAIATIKAGTNGQRVKVRFRATSSLANTFEDDIVVAVKDY